MDKFFDQSNISQNCKYCSITYALSISTRTLKEHVKKNHLEIYKQKTKTEIIPYNQQERHEYNKYLIKWIITSLQPFSVTEEESFIEILKKFNPRYKLPSRHYISSYVVKLFQNQQKDLNEDLQKISNRFLLDIIPFNESHTGANIAKTLMTLLKEYNLTTKIISLTTDNHTVMVACTCQLSSELANFGNFLFSHQRCEAHILNLAVQYSLQVHSEVIEKVRIFMKKVKKSNLLIASWCRLFELDRFLYLGLEIDTEIRWNSTYLMLIKFLKIRIQVNMLIAQNSDDFNDLIFTNNNWANIYELIPILKPMYSVTLSLSSSSFSTIGDFYFTFWTLKQKLEYEIINNMTQYIMADLICHKFNEYYLNINDTIKITTILDPHVKCSVYEFGDETNNAIFLLCSKMIYYSTTTTQNTLNQTELSLESILFNQSNARTYLRNLANQFCLTIPTQPNINNELERYLAIPIDENCNLLEWLDSKTARALLCLKSWISEKIGENINNVNIEDIDDIDYEMD
ncbi:5380_t:CDS:2, partial [Scutellospora calospora]